MIGLIVVVGLIAMYFPYKKGGTLSKLQMRLFGTEIKYFIIIFLFKID